LGAYKKTAEVVLSTVDFPTSASKLSQAVRVASLCTQYPIAIQPCLSIRLYCYFFPKVPLRAPYTC
jgi:hypothetical protein